VEVAGHGGGFEGRHRDHAARAATSVARSELRHSCVTPFEEWTPKKLQGKFVFDGSILFSNDVDETHKATFVLKRDEKSKHIVVETIDIKHGTTTIKYGPKTGLELGGDWAPDGTLTVNVGPIRFRAQKFDPYPTQFMIDCSYTNDTGFYYCKANGSGDRDHESVVLEYKTTKENPTFEARLIADLRAAGDFALETKFKNLGTIALSSSNLAYFPVDKGPEFNWPLGGGAMSMRVPLYEDKGSATLEINKDGVKGTLGNPYGYAYITEQGQLGYQFKQEGTERYAGLFLSKDGKLHAESSVPFEYGNLHFAVESGGWGKEYQMSPHVGFEFKGLFGVEISKAFNSAQEFLDVFKGKDKISPKEFFHAAKIKLKVSDELVPAFFKNNEIAIGLTQSTPAFRQPMFHHAGPQRFSSPFRGRVGLDFMFYFFKYEFGAK
jgi:hypothetical protein